MNAADEMRKLTEETNQRYALKKKEDDAAATIRAKEKAEATKLWWLADGIPRLLIEVRQAAGKGLTFYEEVIDDCPDYVVEALKGKGFEVKCTTEKRGIGWDDADNMEQYYTHVLTIRWS